MKNYVKLCDRTLFLLSTFEGFTAVPDALFDLGSELDLGSKKLNLTMLNECKRHVEWPVAIGVDMDKIYEPGSRYTFDFDSWVSGELHYEDGFSLDAFVSQWSKPQQDDMLYYSQILTSRIINNNIRSVKFISGVSDSAELQDGWTADSLSAIIYYILHLKISRKTKIRICANTTCGKPFEIVGNYNHKIYCTTGCAKTQGKRNEREKEKLKNSVDGSKSPKKRGRPRKTPNIS